MDYDKVNPGVRWPVTWSCRNANETDPFPDVGRFGDYDTRGKAIAEVVKGVKEDIVNMLSDYTEPPENWKGKDPWQIAMESIKYDYVADGRGTAYIMVDTGIGVYEKYEITSVGEK